MRLRGFGSGAFLGFDPGALRCRCFGGEACGFLGFASCGRFGFGAGSFLGFDPCALGCLCLGREACCFFGFGPGALSCLGLEAGRFLCLALGPRLGFGAGAFLGIEPGLLRLGNRLRGRGRFPGLVSLRGVRRVVCAPLGLRRARSAAAAAATVCARRPRGGRRSSSIRARSAASAAAGSGASSGSGTIEIVGGGAAASSAWSRRSSPRWIFPLAVFGSSSTNAISRGYL